jgi:hypothetical protein
MAGWLDLVLEAPDKAVSEALLSASLDPFSYEIGGNVVSILRAAGRHDLALIQIRQMIGNGVGDDAVLRAWLIWEYTELGNLNQARLHLDTAVALERDCCKRTRVLFLAQVGELDSARKLVQEVEFQRTSRYYRAEFLAEARAAIGDTAATFKWLEVAYRDRSFGFPYFRYSPEIKRFQKDPRYANLLKLLRLPPSTPEMAFARRN